MPVLPLITAFLLTTARPSSGPGTIFEKPLSPRIANYRIAATLDPNAKTIMGHEVLTWRNSSSDLVHELQFHLYMNAFKTEKSTFMRERRGLPNKAEERGHIKVNSVRIADGPDLTRSMTPSFSLTMATPTTRR